MKVKKLGGNVTGINKPAKHASPKKPHGDAKVYKVATKGGKKKC